MMAKKNPALFYGVLCGLSMCVWVLLEFFLGFHTTSIEIGQYSGYVAFLFPAIYINVALHTRKSLLGNDLTFVEGINTGFRLSFFYALILTLFFYFYNTYINPDWISASIEFQRKKLMLNGATNDEIGHFIEQNKIQNSALGQAIMGFISSTGIGVLFTLIEIPIVKRFHFIFWHRSAMI